VWRIHRRIGMSGGSMANAILRETGHKVTAGEAARLLHLHREAYAQRAGQVRPLPAARELLRLRLDICFRTRWILVAEVVQVQALLEVAPEHL
jgi:hypothetical protein